MVNFDGVSSRDSQFTNFEQTFARERMDMLAAHREVGSYRGCGIHEV
jgi:hypothetical protein